MLASSFAEVVSLGSIMPFLALLTAPEHVMSNRFVAGVVYAFGMNSANRLLLPITVIFATSAVASGAIRMLLIWLSTRLAFASGTEISCEAYRRTLYQPYRLHLSRNSSEVISGVVNKVGAVVHGVLVPFPTMVSSVMLIVIVTIALIAISPEIALSAAIGFGACYASIAWIYRRRLRRDSEEIAYQQAQVIKSLQEGLGGIRDVLLDGTQPYYCAAYTGADRLLKRAQSDLVFIGVSPRYAMEAAGLVIVAVLAYVAVVLRGGAAEVLPVLGALALGAQRLLPALQQTYGSWVSIAGSRASIRDTIDLLDQSLPGGDSEEGSAALPFERSIAAESISFRYAEDGPLILQNVDFLARKGMRIGIVGRTGSGKSTLLDILMGLLAPGQGRILIDGQPLAEANIRTWQRMIAHVPQNIFLADASLAENIAFGIAADKIEMDRVRTAADQARIADFIESLPAGYGTMAGERGVRLSGGQRQRIGIARALYKQAAILVFDEATSALDNSTEEAVMTSLEDLSDHLTMFVIAHRLSTIRHCDKIIELDHGKIAAEGTYDELCCKSESFRAMVQTGDAGQGTLQLATTGAK